MAGADRPHVFACLAEIPRIFSLRILDRNTDGAANTLLKPDPSCEGQDVKADLPRPRGSPRWYGIPGLVRNFSRQKAMLWKFLGNPSRE